MYTIVTGGAGFIGSVFVAKLNSVGISDIIVVDNLASSEKWKNLRARSFSDYLHKDEFLQKLERGAFAGKVQSIIHLGACSTTTERDVDYLMRNNVHYSQKLAEFAVQNKVRFIYASSGATYGDGSLGFDDDPALNKDLKPLNPYGYSKLLFDSWAQKKGILGSITGIRFFNVFGPNEYHKGEQQSVVRKAWEQVKSAGRVKLFASNTEQYQDGEQQRDFVYVKDCAEVLWQLIDLQSAMGIYNLGSGKARSWNDLANSVFSSLSVKPNIDFVPMPAHLAGQYQNFTEAKMNRLLNCGIKVQFHTLENAVRDYVVNYLEKPEQYL